MPEIKTASPPFDFRWKNLVQSRWIYPLSACFLLVILFSAKQIGTYDLGMHLAGGRWIVQHHSFPAKDTFTTTQTDRDYLDFHGLYQIILYLTEKFLGYGALTLLHMGVISLCFVLLFWRLKWAAATPGWTCLLMVAAVLLLERRCVARPEVFSWLFLSLTLLVLDLRARGRNYLFYLPLIQLFWVNTEALFMLGWLAMGSYLISSRIHQKRWDAPLIRFSLFSLGADLLNPYFIKGAAFPLVLLTRFQSGNPFRQTISEFSTPWQYFQTQKTHHDFNLQILLFFLLAVLSILGTLLTLRQRKFHEVLLLAAFGWLGFSMVRNIPLFALVAAPILASQAADFSSRWKGEGLRGGSTPILMALLIFLLGLRVVTNAYYIGDRRVDRLGIGLGEDRLPVKAAEFLTSRRLNGRLLNNLGFGGWLDWKGPQPVFIDGRLEVMDSDFYGEYLKSFQGNGLSQLVLRYQPQLILAEYNSSSSWIEQLRSFADWRLIYLDECTAIYAHGDYARECPPLSYAALLSDRRIAPSADEAAAKELEQTNSNPFLFWLEGFYRPRNYSMGLSSLGLFSLRAGEYPAARDFFMECLRRSRGGYEEIYFNLGVTYLHLKNFALGKAFLQRALKLNPQNPSTLQMLSQLQAY